MISSQYVLNWIKEEHNMPLFFKCCVGFQNFDSSVGHLTNYKALFCINCQQDCFSLTFSMGMSHLDIIMSDLSSFHQNKWVAHTWKPTHLKIITIFLDLQNFGHNVWVKAYQGLPKLQSWCIRQHFIINEALGKDLSMLHFHKITKSQITCNT